MSRSNSYCFLKMSLILLLRLQFNYNIFPSLSSLWTLSYTPSWSSSNSWLLFTNFIIWIYVYVHTYIFLNITPSVHIIIYMYAFRADLLALGNQLIWPSLGRIISPLPSFPQLSAVLLIGLRPRRLSPSAVTCLWLPFLLSSCASIHVGETL